MAGRKDMFVRTYPLFYLFMILLFYLPCHQCLIESGTAFTTNYVTPIGNNSMCSSEEVPCLTLEEYASHSNTYFVNNTLFYFLPGIHRLAVSLKVVNVANLTMMGLPEEYIMASIALESSVNLAWINCSNIEISLIILNLTSDFTFGIVFGFTHSVSLSNISVFGNGHMGCSSIKSRASTIDVTDSEFIGISGYAGAAMSITEGSSVTFHGNNLFSNNVALSGGAISLGESRLNLKGHTRFFGNKAVAGQSLLACDSDLYNGVGGGAISSRSSTLLIYGSSFVNNTAQISGGAIDTSLSQISIQGSVFHSNTAHYGGAIQSVSSNFTFKGTIHFVENAANVEGGAVALYGISRLNLSPPLNVSFILNHAFFIGGALYIEDDRSTCSASRTPTRNECFLSINGYPANLTNISLLFINNSAADSGSTLYGGELDNCRLYYTTNNTIDRCGNRVHNVCIYSDDALGVFLRVSKIYKNVPTSLNISSPAQQIKLCQGNDRVIDQNNNAEIWDLDGYVVYNVEVYPGKQFYIPVVAIGQANSAVPAKLLHAQTSPFLNYLQFRLSPESQDLNISCTNATLRLYSSNDSRYFGVQFKLFPGNEYLSITPAGTLQIHVYILKCPPGFILSQEHHKCTCDTKISKFTLECDIDMSSIGRMKNNFWISKGYNKTIIIHEFECPLDYCKSGPVNFTLENSIDQCDFNRNGTLCGQCAINFSLALGSLQCGHHYIALLIPFALSGVVLIAVLLLLRLTVASGTLSGLIFYANIVQANHQVFFPRATINIATYFVSWLNLDLGIETCFYEGMDIYVYSWLQFLYPFYIWLLIGIIIIVSRYSKPFAAVLGQNPIAVLATLLLMSYSKILKAIIAPLSFTHLTYYNDTYEDHRQVWLYDGSVGFFKEPKHVALGLFAILSLVCLVIPYILLLLCGYWLQGFSNWCALSWLNKIKPIMDAYYAPYRKGTRYWIGLLLITRVGLFAINTLSNPSIDVLAISTVAAALLALQGRIYEHRFNDVLESVSLLNLCIFSVGTFYLMYDSRDADVCVPCQLYLSSISVVIAFITFLVIIMYHFALRIRSTDVWNKHCSPLIHTSDWGCFLKGKVAKDSQTNTQVNADIAAPTSTVVDINLREPLIELNEAV